MKVKSLSHVRPFGTPWAIDCQAPPSVGFSRQEYWSGLPFPSPEDLPDPGIKPGSPTLQAGSLLTELGGKPSFHLKDAVFFFKFIFNWRMIALQYCFEDPGSIPGSGRSSGEGNGKPLQYSCLENHWEIPWTEEPGRLQSMGLQRVGHDLVTKHRYH